MNCARCRDPVPPGRKSHYCRECARARVAEWRARQTPCREEALLPARKGATRLFYGPHPPDAAARYCGTCGVRVGETVCCEGARRVPQASWRWWSGDQWTVLFLLCAAEGVVEAAELLLKTGWGRDRLFASGRRLGEPLGATISPYLYTVNPLGALFFITPRGREARV